jgi:hypothetical protein
MGRNHNNFPIITPTQGTVTEAQAAQGSIISDNREQAPESIEQRKDRDSPQAATTKRETPQTSAFRRTAPE